MFKRKNRAEPVSTCKAYELWSSSYPPEAHNLLMEKEQQSLLDLLPASGDILSLDLGCGSGRYLIHLEKEGARALGFDLSLPMLKEAARNCTSPLICGSLEFLPFPEETFDCIVCGLVVGHVPELLPFAREAARVLKPRGCLIYSDFHPFLALHGLKRTFRDPEGQLRFVEHHIHLYSNHHDAMREAGLLITHLSEPAGKTPDSELPDACPFVLVVRAEKP